MKIYKIAQTMNIKTNPEAVKAAFKEMEYKTMEESQGWNDWLNFLEMEAEGLPECILEEMPWGIFATIQGQGGWHRYHIHGDGEVTFDESHAMDDATKKARQLGFVAN